LTDRGRQARKRDDQLGKADFEASPYAEIPRRKRARARINTPPPPSLDIGWYHDTPPPPEAPQSRRLSRKERRQIRKRHQAMAPPAALTRTRRRVRRRKQSRWGVKLLGIVAASVVLVTLGSERFLGAGGEGSGATRTTPTAVIALVPSPVATQTETATAITPDTPTPEPTATPTPDPRFVGKVVCLDPGHGGSDRGYTREADDVAPAMEEAVLNLAYAMDLKSRLEAHGFTVVLTRETDDDVNAARRDVNGDGLTYADSERAKDLDELQARINICNNADADLLVSMHLNGFPDETASGYETWYNAARKFRDLNQRFATIAFRELGRQMRQAGYNPTPRRVNDDSTAHAAIERDAFENYVITGPAHLGQIVPSAMPGAIVEALFISNDDDAAFMATAEGSSAIVSAYEHAIVDYFDETLS
jgi:N-acetylmuramoyl-L-alanine amidase